MHWLHFIGKTYYKTPHRFCQEAEKYGVSRRITRQDLAKMAYGDLVVLAMKDGKTAIVFAQFSITKLSGFSPAAIQKLSEEVELEQVSEGGGTVYRECGAYILGGVFAPETGTTLDFARVAQVLSVCDDPGKLMVGGELARRDVVRIKDIPHRQGFRPFDLARFERAVETAKALGRSSVPVVRGQFYVGKPEPLETRDPRDMTVDEHLRARFQRLELEEVVRYVRKEEMKNPRFALLEFDD